MARRPRVVVEGGVYHVYNRISSGEAVFADPNEAIEFIEIIREVKKRDGWTVFAWSVMSNHFHLVIRTSAVPLWRGMHTIQNRFSRGFNRRYRRTGSLWQSRYKAKFVNDQSFLDSLVLYVHLNPVKAGLVTNPSDYSFCGHREVKKKIREPLVNADEMLLCFGTTQKQARKHYLAAIRAGIDPGSFEIDSPWHPFDFPNDIPLEVDAGAEHVDALGRSTGLGRPALEAAQFIKLVCEIAEFDQDQLASRVRDRQTATMRRMVVTLGVERWEQRGAALAEVLNKNPDVVSWWVGEGIRLRLNDSDFAAELDRLDAQLSSLLIQSQGRDGGE
ncbi:MAG: hypothetical protein DRJ65_10705 [Acidobacteria bacterium]|nr:MAG: hypothetical protein DRJ65_10705 [Acidobacteriota bacterium]